MEFMDKLPMDKVSEWSSKMTTRIELITFAVKQGFMNLYDTTGKLFYDGDVFNTFRYETTNINCMITEHSLGTWETLLLNPDFLKSVFGDELVCLNCGFNKMEAYKFYDTIIDICEDCRKDWIPKPLYEYRLLEWYRSPDKAKIEREWVEELGKEREKV